MSEAELLQLATAIADELFTNGQGQRAERLVLTSRFGSDLGGWCQRAVIDVIARQLRATLSPTLERP